jgi:SAM-dependent methyltransferase
MENYASTFGLEWTKHARTQYDSYTGSKVSERRFFEETKWPGNMEGQLVLEVGSGSGRFTEIAASTGATLVSTDYSYAVDSNYASNGNRDNVLIVHSDIYRMPFRLNSFDRIFCFGVLQHTPRVEEAFRTIVKFLREGGSLVIDVYRKPTGMERVLNTKYMVRPISKRIPSRILYSVCNLYINLMWPLSKLIHRIPRGSAINWKLLIPDYRGRYDLPEQILKEWTLLDMFDMLSPVHDHPQTLETVKQWFRDVGIADADVGLGYNGIVGRGTMSTPM